MKIKPCPFCGNDSLELSALEHFVCCRKCGNSGPDGADKKEAIRLWNSRIQQFWPKIPTTEVEAWRDATREEVLSQPSGTEVRAGSYPECFCTPPTP